MNWDKLRIFHTVAETRNLTRAGEVLNLSQSAVSRQISNLERNLKTPLFHRHARGLMLTEQGEMLFETTHQVAAKLAMAEALITESKEKPKGPLKISTTVAFGSVWLAPRIHEFLECYPHIDVSIVLADTELDLSMREADIGIRLNAPKEPDLIRRPLMKFRYHVCAAPQYIEKFGLPNSLEDLDHHRIIVYGSDAKPPVPRLNWLLEIGREDGTQRIAALRLNSIYGIFRAVQSGLGIGALPNYMSQEVANLIVLLPNIQGPEVTAYFCYPEEMRNSARITAFRDFLYDKINL